MDKSKTNAAVATGAASAAWAVAGAGAGGLSGAAWGAAAPLIERTLHALASRSWASLAANAASDEEAFTQLLETLVESEPGQELLLKALDAARWTTAEEKLRAFGRTLAAAAEDDAKIDQEILLVEAISAISSQHIRALRVLARTQGENGLVKEGSAPSAGYAWDRRAYDAEDVGDSDHGLRGSVTVLMGLLVAHGLAVIDSYMTYEEDVGPPRTIWTITGMGALLVQRSEAAIAESEKA